MKNYLASLRAMSPLQIAFGLSMFVLAIVLFAHGNHAAGFLVANAGGITLEDVTKLFAEKSGEFGVLADHLKGAQKELAEKYEKGEQVSRDLKESVDQMLSKFNGLREQIGDLEQKMAEGVKEQQRGIKSWGDQVVESDRYKEFAGKGTGYKGSFGLEVKQVNSAAAGGLIVSQRETQVVGLPKQRRVMRDLLTIVPITTSSVDYPIQLSRTNAAAPVAEGSAKPYSDYAWDSATANVRTIAHLAKLTRQAMDDAPRLVGEINQEMRYGLGLVEEAQMLYGNGTGQNLHGIVPQATAFAKPTGYVDAKAHRIDILRLAALQVSLSLFPADGIVLNDTDWALIELTKDDNGNYIIANPQGSVDARMWNLPVVPTPAMNLGDFLVGGFGIGATLYDRMGVEVLISTENADDFEKNLATMRAEERLALAVKRASAFVTGAFGAAITAVKTA